MSEFAILRQQVRGKIVSVVDEGYNPSIYQYALSSYKDKVAPFAVFYPSNDLDIQNVITFAKTNGLHLAIRTGGHHYTAASSTSGRNFQLDLSHTYTDFQWAHDDRLQITAGVSIALNKLVSNLARSGRFVPTGQCSYVHLGGHVQSGGFGTLIRGFGLLADRVQRVRIINADSQVQWLRRGVPADKELFYAVLGGSPGNFGVVTHVVMDVFRDEDHPESRGLFGSVPYTRKQLHDLLAILVWLDEKDDTPADYDYCVTVLSERKAEGRPDARIVIFAQWANLPGGPPYDPTFFDKIQETTKGTKWAPYEGRDCHGKAPMSTLSSQWAFPIAREFQVPYQKRAYITEARGAYLRETKWVEWATDRIDELVSHPENGVYAVGQFAYFGGKKSRLRTSDPHHEMSYSWRNSNFLAVMDAFHEPEAGAAAKAKEWADKNDRESTGRPGAPGKFSKEDRRLLWGSHDLDLHAVHEHYYDSTEKYQRLGKTKKAVDPALVFTANDFAVRPYP